MILFSHSTLSKWARICSYLFIGITLLEGILRWILASRGLEYAIYIRDVVLTAALVLALFYHFCKRNYLQLCVLIACFATLSAWAVLGYFTYKNAVQAAFGVKLFLAFLAGLAVNAEIVNTKYTARIFTALWLVVFIGICFSLAGLDPWKGFYYDVGAINIEGQRTWTVDSIDRLGGFARNSGEAGCQIAALGMMVLACSKRWWSRLIVASLSVGGIYLTTARSALFGILAGLVVWVVMSAQRARPFRMILVPLPLVSAVALAFGLLSSSFVDSIAKNTGGGVGSTSSFIERADIIWRDGIDLLTQSSLLLGRGVGGIGTSQKMFEVALYNPADNFALYILVAFGIPMSLLIFGILTARWIGMLRGAGGATWAACAVAAFFGIGISLSTIELGTNSFLFGAGLMAAVTSRRQRTGSMGGNRWPRPVPSMRPILEEAQTRDGQSK